MELTHYTPAYRVSADGEDISAVIQPRCISLSIVDQAGIESDSMSLKLDDRDGLLEMPPRGRVLTVALGYDETGLVTMGQYVVDDVVIGHAPNTMTINAKAADTTQQLTAPKTRTWQHSTSQHISLNEIVSVIAREHGLTPVTSVEYARTTYGVVNQTAESDINLLTRLASDIGAIAKPVAGRLILVPRGQAKSASGQALEGVTLSPNAVQPGLSVRHGLREQYGSVVAYYHDTDTAQRKSVKAGSEAPELVLRDTYDDETAAQQAAQSRLRRATQSPSDLSFSMPGDTAVSAEVPLTLTGFRSGIDGQWVCERVTHKYDSSGFITSVTAVAA